MSQEIYQCETEKNKSLMGLHTQKDIEDYFRDLEYDAIRRDEAEKEAIMQICAEEEDHNPRSCFCTKHWG